MIALSRTARIEDDTSLGVSQTIQKYISSIKRIKPGATFRHKFWDYSIALRLIKENPTIDRILDIGLNKSDAVFRTLLEEDKLTLDEVWFNDLSKLTVRDHKYPLVTCFGILEHVELRRAFFNKLLKHVEIEGLILITTDNESPKSYKKRTLYPKDMIDLSLVAENMGYELYNLDTNPIDYLESSKVELLSLVLKRVGK